MGTTSTATTTTTTATTTVEDIDIIEARFSKKARGDSVTLIEELDDFDEAVVVEDELIESETDFGSLKSRLSQTLQAIKSWKKSFPKIIEPTPLSPLESESSGES